MDKEALMEKYFSGQISQEDFLLLESLLKKDDGFKKDFYAQLEVRQTIAHEKSRALKKRFERLEKRNAPKTKWYAYAAALAVLIGLGFFYYNAQQGPRDLYHEYFEAYPNVVAPTVRDHTDSVENKMAKALRLYDTGDYAGAAPLFLSLYQQDNNDYAFFYHGVSLMAAGETESAINALESHHWNDPRAHQTNSQWYLGLGHLKLGNKKKAAMHLEEVANSGSPLAKQANEILGKLE